MSNVSPLLYLCFKIAVCDCNSSSVIDAYFSSSATTVSAIFLNFFKLFLSPDLRIFGDSILYFLG